METQTSSTLWLGFCRGCISPIYVHNLPRLRTLNANRSNEENGITLKKRQEADDTPHKLLQTADDIALLPNTLTQAKSLLHSLEQAAGDIVLHVNEDKTEYMCLNQKGDIKWYFSEISGQVYVPRKQRLIYWKWHQYAPLAKAWTATNTLSII